MGRGKSRLLILEGTLKNKTARILLDSGATVSFVDSKFAKKVNLGSVLKVTPDLVELANGETQESKRFVPNAPLRIV